MNSNFSYYKIINYLFVAIISALILWQVSSYIRNQAIDGCAKNSNYAQEFPNDFAKATYPIADHYEKCLEDKEIK